MSKLMIYTFGIVSHHRAKLSKETAALYWCTEQDAGPKNVNHTTRSAHRNAQILDHATSGV